MKTTILGVLVLCFTHFAQAQQAFTWYEHNMQGENLWLYISEFKPSNTKTDFKFVLGFENQNNSSKVLEGKMDMSNPANNAFEVAYKALNKQSKEIEKLAWVESGGASLERIGGLYYEKDKPMPTIFSASLVEFPTLEAKEILENTAELQLPLTVNIEYSSLDALAPNYAKNKGFGVICNAMEQFAGEFEGMSEHYTGVIVGKQSLKNGDKILFFYADFEMDKHISETETQDRLLCVALFDAKGKVKDKQVLFSQQQIEAMGGSQYVEYEAILEKDRIKVKQSNFAMLQGRQKTDESIEIYQIKNNQFILTK